jgi:hypothetical protein
VASLDEFKTRLATWLQATVETLSERFAGVIPERSVRTVEVEEDGLTPGMALRLDMFPIQMALMESSGGRGLDELLAVIRERPRPSQRAPGRRRRYPTSRRETRRLVG